MKINSTSVKNLSRVVRRAAVKMIKKQWFYLVLILVIPPVLNQKDFNFEIALSASTIFEDKSYTGQNEPIALKKRMSGNKALIKDAFSFGNFSFFNNNPIENEKMDQNQKNVFEKKADRSFLSFIFHHDDSGKHSIDPAIIADREAICTNYINRFAPVAVAEMKKYGIPASIKLAQALYHSEVGRKVTLKTTNNHFGIMCFSKSCKSNHCSSFSSEGHKVFHRNYGNAWEGFRAHSLLLQKEHYSSLKEIRSTNYEDWAMGLESAGYATDKEYAEKLILIIEYFNLNRFDVVR